MQNPEHSRRPWTQEDMSTLKKLVVENTPTRILALKLKRSEDAIRSKANKIGLSLKPTNRSPYG